MTLDDEEELVLDIGTIFVIFVLAKASVIKLAELAGRFNTADVGLFFTCFALSLTMAGIAADVAVADALS